jgi:hypothetical protein
MITTSTYGLVNRLIALMVVSFVLALYFKHGDTVALSRLGPNPSPDLLAHQQKVHGHSVLVHFVMFAALGVLYLALVDGLAFLVGLTQKKST